MSWRNIIFFTFLVRDSIIMQIAHYMLSPVRLSVCSTQGWISQKLLKLWSCNFHDK